MEIILVCFRSYKWLHETVYRSNSQDIKIAIFLVGSLRELESYKVSTFPVESVLTVSFEAYNKSTLRT